MKLPLSVSVCQGSTVASTAVHFHRVESLSDKNREENDSHVLLH